MSRVAGQQNEQNQDNVKKLKTRECQKQQQQGGGEQEHGVETTWTDGPGPLWELHGTHRSSIAGPHVFGKLDCLSILDCVVSANACSFLPPLVH